MATTKKTKTRRKKATTKKTKTVRKKAAPKKTTKKSSVVRISKRRTKFVPRPLCFTTSYKRPYHLYNCISNILNNQSYKNINYVVGVCVDNKKEENQYKDLLKDFIPNKRLKLFFHPNLDQHENYLYAIKQIDRHKYNLFIKIDDDDIYKTNYLENLIQNYCTYNADIMSSSIKSEINNNVIKEGSFDSIGHWPQDSQHKINFGMPFTYAFNNKALEIILKCTVAELHAIHAFEDPGWRTRWREHNLKSYVIHNSTDALYNIHGSNVSSSYLLDNKSTENNSEKAREPFFDNEFCTICIFEHSFWSSHVYLNKRNNRMYHIENDDHGAFEIVDDNAIKIVWDTWGDEMFYKHETSNNEYYYSASK